MNAGIVGAGIMGRLLALALIQKGWQVTLFEKENNTGCSHAAAGLLAPITELDKNALIIYQMGKVALGKIWPKIISTLAIPLYFKKLGTLVLSHPNDRSELTHFTNILSKNLTADERGTLLVSKEIAKLEPELNQFSESYFASEEGHIDSQQLLEELEVALVRKAVEWCDNTFVSKIEPKKITIKSKKRKFDFTFDCRGLGASSTFPALRGIKGELIWVHAPSVTISRPIRLLHPRYNLYLVPRPDNIYILGASELETNCLTPISVRTTLELLSAAYYLHPGFADAHIIKTVVHLRPTLPNHQPEIQYTDGMVAVNGLYRHGFLIATTLCEDIMRFLEGGISSVNFPTIWKKSC